MREMVELRCALEGLLSEQVKSRIQMVALQDTITRLEQELHEAATGRWYTVAEMGRILRVPAEAVRKAMSRFGLPLVQFDNGSERISHKTRLQLETMLENEERAKRTRALEEEKRRIRQRQILLRVGREAANSLQAKARPGGST